MRFKTVASLGTVRFVDRIHAAGAAMVVAGCAAALPVAAQDGGWDGVIGLGVISGPTFNGSDETEGGALPLIDLTWGDRIFVNTERGVGAYVFGPPDAPLRLGVGLGYSFDERDPDDDDRLTGLATVEASPELNLFLEYEVGVADVEFAVSRAFGSDGHEGTTAELSVGFDAPVGERGIVSLSPFVTWGNGAYTDALYGVSASEAAASSLPAFDGGSGFESVGLELGGAYFVTERVGLFGSVEASRLVGDAKDSPISFDDTQVEVALGVLYRF